MSNNKRYVLLILFQLCALMLWAQGHVYSGHVTDASGKALANVSVLLLNEKGNNITFTRTDKSGNFSITTPEGKTASKIGFVCLGYARQNIPLASFAKGDKTIKMQEKVQEIREVEVHPDQFRIKGDTIAYSVSGLREKQDRTIEDVISRIPGIKVSTNGTILYRNAPINKFYVDGKDMAGDSYAMVSKNLSADKVDSVEVLQHHQPINALRGKTFSDAAALNLIIKPGAKFRWTGTAEAGTGSTLQKPWKWDRKIRLVEMYLGNKLQSINIYKHNNIGEDIIQELGPMGYDFGETSKLSNLSGIGTGRYGFNNTHLLATNWHTTFKKHTDLRLQLSWIFDKSTTHSYSEQTYLDIDNGGKISEDRSSQSYANEWKAELTYNYNGTHFIILNQMRGTMNYKHSHATTVLNGRETYERVLPRRRKIYDQLNITLADSKKGSQAITSEFQHSYMPWQMRLYNGHDEQLNLKSTTWDSYYSYRYNFASRFNVSASLGYDMERKTEFVSYNDTIGSTHYKKDMIIVNPSINYFHNNFNASIIYKLSWLSRSLTTDKDRRWISQPTARISLFRNPWTLLASYQHTFTPSGFEETDPLRVYTSYNYATSGTGKNNHSSGDNASLRINYQQPGYGWNGSLSYNFTSSKFSTLYESTLNGGVYIRESVNEKNSSQNNSVQASIGHRFRRMRTDLGLTCDYGWRNYQILYDKVKRDSKGQNFSMMFHLNMRPLRIFNFEENSTFYLSRQTSIASTTLYRNFSHKLNLFLTPGSFVFAMKNECRHSADGSEKFSLFSDLSASFKTKKYELKLICNNLWGTNKREYKSITDLGSNYAVTEMRPREMVASITFDL